MKRPRLQTLLVEVTQACDHACLYCYNHWRARGASGPAPDVSDLRPLLVHVLDQVDCTHVTLTGGEPLLRDDLEDLVAFLAERDLRINLITNGHRMTDARAKELIRCGVSLFELPLLSHRRSVHDHLAASAGAFDAVLAALARIRTHRGQAVAAFVATRLNIADLEQTIRLAMGFGVRGIMLNRFNPGGRGATHIDDLLPTLEQVRAALAVAETSAQQYSLPISCSIPVQPCLLDLAQYPHVGHGFCGAGAEHAYYALQSDGDVRPCNHSPSVLGNAWLEPFAEIVAPERLRGFVDAVPADCRPCARVLECQGGCKAAAQVCYGDLCAEEPFLRANRDRCRICLPGPASRGGGPD